MTLGKFRIYVVGGVQASDAVEIGTNLAKKLGMSNLVIEFVRIRHDINYAETLVIWAFPLDDPDDPTDSRDFSDVRNGASMHDVPVERFSVGMECVSSRVFRAKLEAMGEGK